MAGLPKGGNGTESPDRTSQFPLQRWQASSAPSGQSSALHHSVQVLPQSIPPSVAAQCSPSSHIDSVALLSALALEQHVDAATLNQEKTRVDLERIKVGGGDRDSSASSASVTEQNEQHDDLSTLSMRDDISALSIRDDISALSVQDDHSSRRSNVSSRQNPSMSVGQDLSAVRVELARSERLSPTLEYISALAHLTTFGILGVCIRYGLRILFSDYLHITSDSTPLLFDMPSNMVGCFFMGWVGVVLKRDIAAFSELLAIGLSTGLMGSITTYASWNQAMIVLITNGFWLRSIVSLIVGMELFQMSLMLGIDSAKLLRSVLTYIRRERIRRGWQKQWDSSPDNLRRRKIGMLIFLVTSTILWAGSLGLTVTDVNSAVRRRLWLSCLVGPPGVWARWCLARLNGQGIGRNQRLKWLPIGTFLTNLVASVLQAVLSVVILSNPEDASLLCRGLQIGLLGCMSTVSTFVTEIFSLRQSPKRWRAYAYLCLSLISTYCMGVIAYTVPVLTHPFAP
ncbi:uncharacterized protein [Physcomitrium patens]|uniref:uncharacterized protein isoform X2 n=1 Tax=Physcomitrium patens TaxID=3218 RepID=UPI000D1526D2|nr:fluoride export protein 1-like isoform X2 [Physcomitrium patens]|eukprot:XP_024378055.1 fluoride export protein 1-like isoform X2 [Physcomitrella patens]